MPHTVGGTFVFISVAISDWMIPRIVSALHKSAYLKKIASSSKFGANLGCFVLVYLLNSMQNFNPASDHIGPNLAFASTLSLTRLDSVPYMFVIVLGQMKD